MRFSSATIVLAATVLLQPCLPISSGQEPPPPPMIPGSPAPPAGEAEVYNRGPLHEAFAAPTDPNPVRNPIVAKPPPEPIDEVPPEHAPAGDNVVWIPGYWAFDEDLNDFLWVSGVWREAPPQRRWVPGYWTEVAGGWQWIAGAWVDAGAQDLAYLPEPPPSQEHGPTSPAPGDDHFWVPGNWEYGNADYRWRPGRWAPHHANWVWVPAHYVWTPRGCLFIPGFWDFVLGYRGICFAPVYFPGYRWHRPWTPTVAINVWDSLIVHLWARPGYGRYYFGDYYGPRFAQRGFIPFYDYHRRHGYDPLYVYFRWRFGGDFDRRVVGWHRHFEGHEELRPRLTVREQREFAVRNRDNAAVAVTNVSVDLDRLVRAEDSRIAFTSVAERDRQRVAEEARDVREFGRERAAFERSAARAEARVRGQAGERLRITAPQAAVEPRGPTDRDVDRPGRIVPERPDRPGAAPRPPATDDRARPAPVVPREGPQRDPRGPDRELPRIPDGIEGPSPQRPDPGARPPERPQPAPGRPGPGAESPRPERPEQPQPRPERPGPAPERPSTPSPPRGDAPGDAGPRRPGSPDAGPPGGPGRGPKGKGPKGDGDGVRFFPPGVNPPEAPRETAPLPQPDEPPARPLPGARPPGPGLNRPEESGRASERPGAPRQTNPRATPEPPTTDDENRRAGQS